MKYRLTDETKEWAGHILHRIECVEAFGEVKVGEKGGWVESEQNLSQDGDAWVYDNAKVYDNAVVYGNANVGGNAEVYDNAVVYGNARVYGNAEVYGDAEVYDVANVSGNAWVTGNSKVYGNAGISDSTLVNGYTEISGYSNISGNAIVGGNAIVNDHALVYGNAEIYGNAKIMDKTDYIVFKNWWSSGRYFTWTRSNDMWKAGCFYGTGEELIKKAYADSEKSGREYERIVKYVNEIKKEL